MRGFNHQHNLVIAHHLTFSTVTTTPATGGWIVEPWTKGRQISFICHCGDITSTGTNASATLQGRVRGTDGSSPVTLKGQTGTNLVIAGDPFVNTGAADGGTVVLTALLEDIDATTYDAMRISVVSATAGNFPVGVVYMISNLYAAAQDASVLEYLFSISHDDTRHGPDAINP